MPAPEGRPGIYGGPPKTVVPDVPLKTGFFSGGGLKGLAGGLAEGVIGAIIYDAGRNAIDYFMDKIDKDHQAKFDKVMDRASLPAMLERVFGTFGDDKRSSDPYKTGDRAGIDERARRGADDFMRDPEGTRGWRMMKRDAVPPPAPYVDPEDRRDRVEARRAEIPPTPAPIPPEPIYYADPEDRRDRVEARRPSAPPVDHSLDGFVMGSLTPKVDASEITAAGTAAQDAKGHLDALNVAVAPSVNLGPLQNLVALLERAVSLQGQLNSGAAGGSVPGAGAIRAASNRQFAGASQTG